MASRAGSPMTRFRRNHPRFDAPPVVAVLVQEGGRDEVAVRDLSASGALLLTDALLPVGALVDLELRGAGEADAAPLAVRARVARLVGAPAPGVAVEFVEGGAGDAFRLLDFVDRYGSSGRAVSALANEPPAPPGVPLAAPEPRGGGIALGHHSPVPSDGAAATATAAEWASLRSELAQARAAAEHAEELAARVALLERELEAARQEVERLRRLQAQAAPAQAVAGPAPAPAEPREVTLGPDTVRSAQDFGERLKRGARLRPTDRFRTLEPVTRVDHQVADWLRSADRLEELQSAAQQMGGVDHLTAAIYRFFERGLVRITR
jgi:hypothetical protein